MPNSPIRTRFAPSPTGELHIGGVRTALYDYALARQKNGKFILRIEDTDQKRYVKGSEQRIMEDLKSYGLNWDEGPYFQKQHLDIYQKYIQELLDKNLAYYCFCTPEHLKEMRLTHPKYDKHCLSLSKEEINQKLSQKVPYTIRLNVPQNQIIVFNDIIRGQIKFNTNEIDDQILIKSDGIPTYHFAAVVDDHLMNITHIFRGDEWLTSTPKHILLYRFFGWEIPQIGHLSIFLAEGGQKGKMSKRQGSTQARQFLEEGYLPEAVLNFLMLSGWNPGTDQEFFTLEEFVKAFDLTKLNKKPIVFDRSKLNYFNGIYIRKKSNLELIPFFKKFLPQASDEQISVLIPILRERINKFSDLIDSTKFLFEDVDYDKSLLLKKGTSPELALDILNKIKDLLSALKTFDFTTLQTDLMDLIKTNNWNVGEFFMVFRVAVCGVAFTPPVVECLPALGKEKTLKKIDFALSKLTS